jgi:ArsR family transcriptional regulator
MTEKRKIPPEFFHAVAEVIKIIGHPQRLQILEHLDLYGESKAGDIAEAVGGRQGAVSQHLNKMRTAGILAARRDSREIHYRISEDHAMTILNCIRRKFEDMSAGNR